MKKLASALLALLIAFSAVPGMAGDGPEHDKLLEEVLFGTEDQEKLSKKYKKQDDSPLTLIEYACYLTIDQAGSFDSNGKKAFEALKKFHVARMPTDEQILLIHINKGKHRKYTHKGWNYSYPQNDDAKRWEYRKRILLETTKKVFGFQKYLSSAIFGYTAQCDSFAALLYYVHIIDDYKNLDTADKINEMNKDMICFARNRAGKDDVFSELERFLSTLFENQQENKSLNCNSKLQ